MATETAEQPASPADSAPSVEERLGALFGVPEDSPPEAEASEPGEQPQQEPAEEQPEVFEFEEDGNKYQLPKALEKSFMAGSFVLVPRSRP